MASPRKHARPAETITLRCSGGALVSCSAEAAARAGTLRDFLEHRNDDAPFPVPFPPRTIEPIVRDLERSHEGREPHQLAGHPPMDP